MNINELRGGNLVSYKGYHCEVKFVDTFRKHVYIDIEPHINNEELHEEIKKLRYQGLRYLVVQILDVNPINITDDLVEKLKIQRIKVDEYFSDFHHEYRQKTIFGFTLEWEESGFLESMGNVFRISLYSNKVLGDLEFMGDGDGCDFELPHIRYIHQIQNLYFTLTGKDL